MESIQLSLFGKTSWELFRQITDWILRPSWKPSFKPKFQFLSLVNGQTPAWCEGEMLMCVGDSSIVNTGECPNDVEESFSSQILETSVPEKYYLNPKECTRILTLATKSGCRPPKTIEALLLKQGGTYSSIPSKSAECALMVKKKMPKDTSPVSDNQLTLFPLS